MVLCGTWGLPGCRSDSIKIHGRGGKGGGGGGRSRPGLERGGEVMKKKGGRGMGGTKSVLIKSKADLRPSLPVKVCIL